jgi:nicotinate phosphoribosyltransferase
MPNNCIFLVDTYNTLEGVRKAVRVGRRLRKQGHEMIGIRLDSGDLAWLSREARRILDEAGFEKAAIVASNDLDEQTIASLKDQKAEIRLWGVGTRLVTAYDQPALGGVYKMAAVRGPGENWRPCLKLSEQMVKVSTPGLLQVRRFCAGGESIGDMIWNEELPPGDEVVIIDPLDPTRRKRMGPEAEHEELLVPVFEKGRLIYEPPSVGQAQARVRAQLDSFGDGVKRFMNPHKYPVGLESALFALKTELVLKAREAPLADAHDALLRET